MQYAIAFEGGIMVKLFKNKAYSWEERKMSISILENGRIVDRRNGNLSIFAGGEISVCYTLHTDNIKEGKRVSSTPYVDRTDALVTKNGVRYGENTRSTVKIEIGRAHV